MAARLALWQRFRSVASVLLLTVMVASTLQAGDITFEIEAQPLRQALISYSEQARIQLILAVDTAGLPECAALKGAMSPEEALAAMLAGTGLEYHFTGTNTVTIRWSSEYQ